MTYSDCIQLYTLILRQALPAAIVFWLSGKLVQLLRNALDGDLSWE